jgi:hypothetical protein
MDDARCPRRVDHHHVNRALGKVTPRLCNHKCALIQIERRDLMRDINDPHARPFEITPFIAPIKWSLVPNRGEVIGRATSALKLKAVQRYYFDHNATTPVSPKS